MAEENVKVVYVKPDVVGIATDIAFGIGGCVLGMYAANYVGGVIPVGETLVEKGAHKLACATTFVAVEQISSNAASQSVDNARKLIDNMRTMTTAAMTGQVETVTPEQVANIK